MSEHSSPILCSSDTLAGTYGVESATNQATNALSSQVTLYGHVLATRNELTATKADAYDNPVDYMNMAGSYSAAVLQGGRLTLLAEASGQFGLFYTTDKGAVRYSADPGHLTAHNHSINRLALAEMIFAGQSLSPQDAAIHGVKRLLPGTMLQASSSGVQLAEYATLAPTPELTYADAVDKLRHALHEGVSRCVKFSDQLGSDFSGGYDSTVLAFLAAKYLPEGQTLYSQHYIHGRAITGDVQYARAFAPLDPRLRPDYFTVSADTLPFDPRYFIHTAVANTALPVDLPPFAPQTIKRLERLREIGITDNMTGTGGDALFTAGSLYLADLLREGSLKHVPRVLTDLLTEAEGTFMAPRQALAFLRTVARMTIQDAFEIVAEKLETGSRRIPQWVEASSSSMSLLSRDIRQQLATTIAERGKTMRLDPAIGIADYQAIQEARASGNGVHDLRRVAKDFGVAVHAPYLYRSVMEACLGLKAHHRAQAGRFKPLLADAMVQDVPPVVFERRTKGNGNDELYRGLIRHAPALRQFLGRTSCLAELGIIDVTGVQQAITRAELGLRAPDLALGQAVAAEVWLRSRLRHAGTGTAELLPSADNTAKVRVLQPPSPPKLHRKSMATLETLASEPLHVPDWIRIIRDESATVPYNMLTQLSHPLHYEARAFLDGFQKAGDIHDGFARLQDLYPTADPNLLVNNLQTILHNLKTNGILARGQHRHFDIIPAVLPFDDSQAESICYRSRVSTRPATAFNILRMSRSLLRAKQLASRHALYDVVQMLRDIKVGLPFSTPQRVEGLLQAGHKVNHYIGKFACVEYVVAVSLAEAARGRRVDFAAGFAEWPRRFHAWPEVNGHRVQTEYDEPAIQKYTSFGTW